MIRSAVGFSGALGRLATERGAPLRLAPLAEARGSLRAVLAALRNLEHLLRSPRVGPRALAQVIPGLRDLCAPLSASADEIREHLDASLAEEGVAHELSDFLADACVRLESVLAWAAQASMDAKSRLSFEARIGRLTAELSSARRLLDMLSGAAERAHTELDLGEVIQESLSISSHLEGLNDPGVKVVADLPYGVHAFQASVQVIVPLVTFGIAWVRSAAHPDLDGSETPRISVEAVRDSAQSVTLVISHDPLEGDVHIVHPPILIPPVLSCAETSARIGGGSFIVQPDRVRIHWPSCAMT